ncbi:hypothetical protein C0993_005135 [Termitomyces sp. T159_Od127]|nr:hypothetical protein C0993_005135 [Termitomyces sp. T159_Od127]
MFSDPLPPPFASRTDDAAAAAARKRPRTAKTRCDIFLPILRPWSQSTHPPQHATELVQGSTSSLISLDSSPLGTPGSSTDKYKWAVVYENQRGLLPCDPPPFTIPDASHSSKQASISLEDYPLPDGTWRWVSKCWMIDMRSDTGEVQHDGFEYNWMFRAHKWSAEVSSLSAGGWISRQHESEDTQRFNKDHVQTLDVNLDCLTENAEENWQKCCSLMKDLGRDGRKLELWKKWLDEMKQGKLTNVELAGGITSDAADVSTVKKSATRAEEYIIQILRLHGDRLLHSFIYPESRATFVDMLREAGLLHVLEETTGRPSLLPFITPFLTGGSRKTNFQAFIRALEREMGLDGFASAMSLSVGGGLTLRQLWAAYDSVPEQLETLPQQRNFFTNLSPSQKTFIANMASSSFGILLLQAGRRRYHLRNKFPSLVTVTPSLTSQTSTPKSGIRISDTLDLTLLLLVRAADSLLQHYIRRTTCVKDVGAALVRNRVSQEKRAEAATILTSRIDGFIFWACSARIMWCFFYEPERLPKSYVKWIATLANLDGRVIRALRLLREGKWSYIKGSAINSAVLMGLSRELGYNTSWGNPTLLPAYGGVVADAAWKSLGVKNRPGVGGIPCEIVHGSTGSGFGMEGSCTANSLIRGVLAFLEAIVIYLPVCLTLFSITINLRFNNF